MISVVTPWRTLLSAFGLIGRVKSEWVLMSIKPGLTTSPSAAMTRRASPTSPLPMAAMRPPRTATSATVPGRPLPSMTSPPRIRMSQSNSPSLLRCGRRRFLARPPQSLYDRGGNEVEEKGVFDERPGPGGGQKAAARRHQPRRPRSRQCRGGARILRQDLRFQIARQAAGARLLPGPFLRFLDPWGNRIEVVEYRDIQFTKAPHVLRGMGLDLDKSERARKELADKGLAP